MRAKKISIDHSVLLQESSSAVVNIVNRYYEELGIRTGINRGFNVENAPVSLLHQLNCGRKEIVGKFLSFFRPDRASRFPFHFFVVPGHKRQQPESLTERLIIELEGFNDSSVYRMESQGRLHFFDFPSGDTAVDQIQSFKANFCRNLNAHGDYAYLQDFYNDVTPLHQFDYIALPYKISTSDDNANFYALVEWLIHEFCGMAIPPTPKGKMIFFLTIVDDNRKTNSVFNIFKTYHKLEHLCYRLGRHAEFYESFQIFQPLGKVTLEEVNSWLSRFIKEDSHRIQIINSMIAKSQKEIDDAKHSKEVWSNDGFNMAFVEAICSAIVQNNQPNFRLK